MYSVRDHRVIKANRPTTEPTPMKRTYHRAIHKNRVHPELHGADLPHIYATKRKSPSREDAKLVGFAHPNFERARASFLGNTKQDSALKWRLERLGISVDTGAEEEQNKHPLNKCSPSSSSFALGGYLYKLKDKGPSMLRSSWTKRWFQIDHINMTLLYFRNSESSAPRKVISLKSIQSVSAHNNQCFHIESPTRSLLLRTQTHREMCHWVQMLSGILHQLHANTADMPEECRNGEFHLDESSTFEPGFGHAQDLKRFDELSSSTLSSSSLEETFSVMSDSDDCFVYQTRHGTDILSTTRKVNSQQVQYEGSGLVQNYSTIERDRPISYL